MRFGDLVLGLLVLAGGVALFVTSFGFPPMPGQPYGAETMPRVLGMGTIALGLVLAGRGVLRRTAEPAVALAPWTRRPAALGRLALAAGLVAFYVAFAGTLGFAPTAFVVMLGLMLAMGARPLVAVAAAAAATVVIGQAFGHLLMVPLPRTPALDLW
jgi:putative tricarboxylic transport membrane protein